MGAHAFARQLGPVLQRLDRRDEVIRCLMTAVREQSVGSGTTVLKVSVANDTSSIHPSQEYAIFVVEEPDAEIIYLTSVAHLIDGACPLFTVHVTQPSEELYCFPAYPQAGIRSTPICVSYGLKGAGPFAGDLLRTDMVPMWLLCPMLREESILQACARILSLHQSFLLRTLLMLFYVNSISFLSFAFQVFLSLAAHISPERLGAVAQGLPVPT